MQAGHRSRTADAAAALRAGHELYAQDKVFSDPYALQLTSARWRLLMGNRLLHALLLRRVLRPLAPITGQILARSRYAEDCLNAALARGITQYVIVGAGLDSFALRRNDLAHRLKVFEVDHPDTQRAKRARLAELDLSLPANLEYAAVDFERESIADGLARSSHRRDAPAFYSWLGTTHYLRPDTTLATLKAIAACSAPGSEVVLDYSLPRELLSVTDQLGSRGLARYTRRSGEPLIGQFAPPALHAAVEALGWQVVEDLSGADQTSRYFANRSDGLKPTAAAHLLHLRLKS